MRSRIASALSLIALGSLLAPGNCTTAASGKESSTITLTVNVLPTSDDVNGPGLHIDRYPKAIRVENAAEFADHIAAYGAAYQIWIAPKGWIGSAAVAFDGRTTVNLYPPNGSAKSGPRFLYEDSGGCAGCALALAAPYFPSARQSLKELFAQIPQALPHGTKLTRVSLTLVMYMLSGRERLLCRGAAYSIPSNEFSAQFEFSLPRSDSRLLKFLMKTVIRQQKWE